METRGVEVTVVVIHGKCSDTVPHHQDFEKGREGHDTPTPQIPGEEARLTFGDW